MTGTRHQQQGTGSFFGEYVYERSAPGGHFLRQLERLVDWKIFAEKLVRLYRSRPEVGRPRYNPSVILKTLLLA